MPPQDKVPVPEGATDAGRQLQPREESCRGAGALPLLLTIPGQTSKTKPNPFTLPQYVALQLSPRSLLSHRK